MAIAPAWVIMYWADNHFFRRYGSHIPWTDFTIGLVALGAAWYGGERFILRQVRELSRTAGQLAEGDLTSRTGIANERGELAELARTIDTMAGSLQARVSEREDAERTLLNRAFQQTVVGALGQFAMVSNDINALLNQAVMLAAQTLEVEHCHVLEIQPGGKFLLLRAGVGWKDGAVGKIVMPIDPRTEAGVTLSAGEPVTFDHLPTEVRFKGSPLLLDHGVSSGVSVAISGYGQAFGVLGAYTGRRRTFTEDEIHFLFSLGTVLAMAVERIRAEMQLQKLAAFAQLNPNPAMELTAEGAITYYNDAAQKLASSVNREHPRSILPANIHDIVRDCLEARRSFLDLETHSSGRTLSWSFHPVESEQVVHCYVADITERLNLEAQLRQSQKMESIGQLAAGVAHDFNNLLTVIQGHSGIVLAKPNLPPEMLESSQAIYFAAERAAGLTRQLLMFSRKNVMRPKPLDLRGCVTNMSNMLKRVLGEPVNLVFNPPQEIPLVHGDSGMIEQVIMNLAVNARDAMPDGGKLTIAVEPVEVNEDYVQTHPESRTGSFVRLRVSDTGTGMDSATMARIFEPFFTTKDVGKGTGLGLATVYGIVKQHEGWIEVASEWGKGSTFVVFLPATSEPVKASQPELPVATAIKGGTETILVVEDEPVLRDMAVLILEECGYSVMEAGSGAEALRVWNANPGKIDLVLTDMVMPGGMSGRELAGRLLAEHPGTRIIFTSGYNVEETNTDFFRRGGAVFLQKPYTRNALARLVRESLDKPAQVGKTQEPALV
jgi:signal transduction histidine kinase/ActR/RegA family two-component response regulator/HAMP domain-containing protein